MYLVLEEVLAIQAKIIVLSTITLYMKVVILSQSSMVVQSKFLIGMCVGEAM